MDYTLMPIRIRHGDWELEWRAIWQNSTCRAVPCRSVRVSSANVTSCEQRRVSRREQVGREENRSDMDKTTSQPDDISEESRLKRIRSELDC